MSMYNMIHGVNPATFFFLPMLGKHPDEYPRFRDCFVGNNCLQILTRVGGGNREDYQEAIDTLRAMDGYIEDYDEENDCTYATFIFAIPERWATDYALLLEGHIHDISEAYRQELYRVFPKLKEKYDAIFSTSEQQS